MKTALTALALACALSACAPPQRPAPPLSQFSMPDTWREAPAGAVAIEAQWWRGFGDPVLDQLVQAALANNSNLLAAAARVEQARALIEVAESARLPTVSADLGVQAARAPGLRGIATTRALQPELQASWELDF